ncbi:MAG TPA: ATP-binding protein [Candidatus Binatia bacterium]|nr:ATP-binding protein [Candidatus Binatia bacterium]
MDFYALSGLINGIAATILGCFVYARAPRDSRNFIYGLFCLSVSVWSYFYFAWHFTESRELALVFVRLLMVGAIMVPVFYLHHVLTLRELLESHRPILIAGYVLCGIFLLFDFTNFFIADLQPEMSFRYWPKPGLVFHLFLVWFVSYALYAIYLTAVAYLKEKGLRRNQYLYLTVGALIGYVGGATNFPLWYGVQIPPVGTILVTAYTAIMAYTMIQYRLLDFSVIVQKGLLYLLLLFTLAATPSILLALAQKLYFGQINYPFSILLFSSFVLIAIGAYRLREKAEVAIARTLFRQRYDTYETLSAFSKSLVTILDLRSLTDEIIRTLVQVMDIKTASLFLLNDEKSIYILSSCYGVNCDKLGSVRLAKDDALPHQFAYSKSPLVREELEQVGNHGAIRSIMDNLQVMESEVCIPLINKDRLIGFCDLGSRVNHLTYSGEDLNLLTTLAQNAAIALDNAMLYEDLKQSQALMQRTDRLRSLETIAGGFAHEIRNPMTSIKTFIQLAPERKDDPEFISEFSKVVNDDVDRIERLIQEILDYARYMQPKLTEEDLNEIVSSCLYFVAVKADSMSITLETELASDLPRTMLDRQHIKQVLLNLLMNAMDAMADTGGRLTVRTHRLMKPSGDEWVQVEVADTGSGISEANLEHIFDPFYTTKYRSGEHEGTGLGLTIVHQIVQEHRGSIQVESVLGSGTTFFVNLPVSPLQPHLSPVREEHEETDPLGR